MKFEGCFALEADRAPVRRRRIMSWPETTT
jgi:hypothetical protein